MTESITISTREPTKAPKIAAAKVREVPKEFDAPFVLLNYTYTLGFGNAQLRVLYAPVKGEETGYTTKRFGIEFKDNGNPRPSYVLEIKEDERPGTHAGIPSYYAEATIAVQRGEGKLHFDDGRVLIRSDDYRGNFSVLVTKEMHPLETLYAVATALNTCYLLKRFDDKSEPSAELLLIMDGIKNTARTLPDGIRQSNGKVEEILRRA